MPTTEKTDRRARPETREAILARAVDLASAEGLEGLTIGRLAKETGMSKSGLFRHFGSKEELQLAAIGAARERFAREVVTPALQAAEGAPRLRAICEADIDHLERQVFSGGCFWGAVSVEFDDRPGPVRDAVGDAVSAWLGALAGEAQRAGAEDPERLAFEILALGQGANSRFRLLGDRRAFEWARQAYERVLP